MTNLNLTNDREFYYFRIMVKPENLTLGQENISGALQRSPLKGHLGTRPGLVGWQLPNNGGRGALSSYGIMQGGNGAHFPCLTLTLHTGRLGPLAELANFSQNIYVTLPGSQVHLGGVAIWVLLEVFDTHKESIMASWGQIMTKVNTVNTKGPCQPVMRKKM